MQRRRRLLLTSRQRGQRIGGAGPGVGPRGRARAPAAAAAGRRRRGWGGCACCCCWAPPRSGPPRWRQPVSAGLLLPSLPVPSRRAAASPPGLPQGDVLGGRVRPAPGPGAACSSRGEPKSAPLRGVCPLPGGRFVAELLAAPGLVVSAQCCWGLPCTPALPRSCCPVLRACCHRFLPGSRFSLATEGTGGGSAQGISLHREILNPGSSFNTPPCPGLLGVCF